MDTKYVYVVRNTCQLIPEVSSICLEMYISDTDEDNNILSKQQRIANNLQTTVLLDVYYQYAHDSVMLWYKTYTINAQTA